MRLSSIEKPSSLAMKIAYWLSKKQLGKVITPLKTVYVRVPKIRPLAMAINKYIGKSCGLPNDLRSLLQIHVAQLNQCAFCVDIGSMLAQHEDLPEEKLEVLRDFENAGIFSEAEKSALAYVDEATRHKQVSDETFERLKNSHNDTAIAEITLVLAIEHYFNMINIPLQIESDGLCDLARSNILAEGTGAA